MDLVNQILDNDEERDADLNVQKEIDVDIDEGTLLVSDYNALNLKPGAGGLNLEMSLKALTRGNVQLLVNKVWALPTKCIDDTIVAELPKPNYVLPRSRKLPKPKPLTKWQQFAKEKGLRVKKKGSSKLKWDDLLQKWTPAYGFRKAEADKQKEWLVECNEEGKPNEDPFAAIKVAKTERKAKNELQRLRNLAKAKNLKIPKVGLPSSEHFKDAKQLSTGAKVAEVSTASLGRFNEVPNKTKGVKSGKVKKSQKSGKKNKPGKKIGQLKESASKTNRKPKAGKGNRNFRTKLGGRKRRT